MPQIPVYDNTTVQLRPLQLDQASPDSFGAVQGRQLRQAGQDMAAFSEAMGKIAEQDAREETYTADARAKEDFLKWQQEQLNTRKGAAAKGLTDDTAKWWDKYSEESLKNLSPMAQRMTQRAMQQQRSAFLQSMSHYEMAQRDAAEQVALKANLNSFKDVAAANPTNPNVVALQRDGLIQSFQSQRGRLGEAFDQALKEELSGFHKGVIDSLVVSKPGDARAYFDKNKGEIVGTLHDQIEKQLRAGTDAQEGSQIALEAIDKFTKDMKAGDAFPQLEIDKYLIDTTKDKSPEVRAAARQELDRRAALVNNQQIKQIADAGDKVYGMVMKQGMSWAKVESSGVLNGLSDGQVAKIREHILDAQSHASARGVEAMARQQRIIELKNAPKMWEIINDPARLAAMSDDKMRTLWQEIGFDNAAKVAAARQSLVNNQAKLEEAKLDSDMFNVLAEAAGLKPTEKNKSQEQALELVKLRDAFEQRIRSEQQKLKRPLTDPEKRLAAQEVIDNKVLVSGWLGSTEKPAALVPADKQDKAFVKLPDGERVMLASIPAAERAEIIRAFNRNNIPVSEYEIARAWAEKRKQGKK